MGDRLSGGGATGRRRAQLGDAMSGPRGLGDEAGLEALLAAAMRGDGIDPEAEGRAVAAFRAARDAGAHHAPARTRRRDDWRPRERRRASRSLKATLSVALASLTLGGVAFAAIGSVGSSDAGDEGRAHPVTSDPDRAADKPSSAASSGSARENHPENAEDTEARCRAYENVKGQGKALDSTAWQRLVEAAGGEANVDAYCAEQLAQPSAGSSPGRSDSDKAADGSAENGKQKSEDKTAGKNR
ncbi:hypothetical protein [Streptomyces sp. HUAS ZL42]|uniref:hypothetical protein n=1 Tax=Streptomyces sp. HUAS ZL42 TaxID=3231715 RepID=UPI00345E78AA